MPSIRLIEDIVHAFSLGDTATVAALLKKESSLSKKQHKSVVAKRLENLVKKIPGKNNFSSASLDASYRKKITVDNPALVTELASSVMPEQVILNSEIKQKVASLFREWEDREKLFSFGLAPSNKILLYGQPGTGKTMLAHAIANQLDFPLVLVRLDELVSSYLGKTGKNIRDIFEIAHQKNIVLFLDEIDTVAKNRGDEKELGELKRIVTVLLQNIDLFPQNSIIIGATNHEDILDKAIWRRFPVKIRMTVPEVESRAKLFSLFLEKVEKRIDEAFFAKITEGLSGSEIYDLCQQAIKNFIMSGRPQLSGVDILMAYFHLINGTNIEQKISKKNLYALCQKLKDAGFELKEISSISQIPYTTLRDNLK